MPSLLDRVWPSGRGSSAKVRAQILDGGLTPQRARKLAAALEHEGKLLLAVDAWQTANRLRRDAQIERRLVQLRRAAFAEMRAEQGSTEWVAEQAVPALIAEGDRGTPYVAESPGPPVLAATDLSVSRLRDGIRRHGSLLVRGLVDGTRVARLIEGIDHAFAEYDRHAAGAPVERTTPWFDPIDAGSDVQILRTFVRQATGVWTADSPRALYELIETLIDLGLDRLVAAYLGERPALSLEKCTLRRAEPTQTGNAWHQDGAFIGSGIRSINAWFSLSHCGRQAPGLDIVPVRIGSVLPVGTAGALYDWDVAEQEVQRAYRGPIWRPLLEPGDVVFFDHLCVHRTAVEPAMSRRRWAIESWFFAPSVYPTTQTPLVV